MSYGAPDAVDDLLDLLALHLVLDTLGQQKVAAGGLVRARGRVRVRGRGRGRVRGRVRVTI